MLDERLAQLRAQLPTRLGEGVLAAAERLELGVTVTCLLAGQVRVVLASDAACRVLGHPREALLAASVLDLLAPDQSRRMAQSLNQRLQGRDTSAAGQLAVRVIGADGAQRNVTAASARLQLEGCDDVWLSILAETTALQREAARLTGLFLSAPDAMVIWRGTTILDANPAMARVLGLPDVASLRGLDLRAMLEPEQLDRARARAAAVHEGKAPGLTTYRVRRSDGTQVLIEASTIPFEWEGAAAQLTFARDITERERVAALLARSERLAGLGQLAAGVAHEINNPLLVVKLEFAALAEELGPALPPERSAAIQKNLERIAGTVKALKVFAAPPTPDEGGVDLTAVLKRCELLLAPLKNSRTHTEYRVAARLPRVRGEASQLEHVVLALMGNAVQALPEGRPENLILVEAQQQAQAVVLSVRDNGEGIAPEHLPRIFDPFFTTRPVGEGSGLGLSVCHEMVSRAGGSLRAESTQGVGTTIFVTLPLAEPVAPRPSPAPPDDRPRLKVLVVDDEPDLRRTLVRILRRRHDVEVAENGAQVLERVARGERWDVVLCDLLMPNVTGIELYEALLVSEPAVAARMVFMTGGAASERSAEFLRTMTSPRLDKPFDPAELMALIDRIGARAP